MQVLDRQQQPVLAREQLQQLEQTVEQPRLRGGLVVRARLGAPEAGQDLRERGPRGRGQRAERLVPGAGQRPQRGDDRRVRQLALAQLDAVAADHAHPFSPGHALQFGHQPCLAEPGLARDEREPGRFSTASVSPARSSASSGARPTNVVLVTREATTTPVSRAGLTAGEGDTRPSWSGCPPRTSGGWSAHAVPRALHAVCEPLTVALMEAPYGSWPSPIDGDVVARDPGWTHSLVHADGGSVYWSEARSLEGGRDVVVARRPDGTRADAIPAGCSARTRVHEYGGGAYTVHAGTVYFCSDADQRVYAMRDGTPAAITPEPETEHGLRYADLQVARRPSALRPRARRRARARQRARRDPARRRRPDRPRDGPRLLRRPARLPRRQATRLARLGPPPDAVGGLRAPRRRSFLKRDCPSLENASWPAGRRRRSCSRSGARTACCTTRPTAPGGGTCTARTGRRSRRWRPRSAGRCGCSASPTSRSWPTGGSCSCTSAPARTIWP